MLNQHFNDDMTLIPRSFARINAEIERNESTIIVKEYDDLPYSELVPVDSSSPDFIKMVTYHTLEHVGQADWINGGAQDIPYADFTMGSNSEYVRTAALGYGYTWEEINQSLLYGMPLATHRVDAVRRGAEELANETCLYGAPKVGFKGFINRDDITVLPAVNNAAGTSAAWKDKTAQEILADVNRALSTYTDGRIMSSYAKDTILLPPGSMELLASRITGNTDRTLLEFIQQSNMHTARTRQPLEIREVAGLDKAGAGNTSRLIAYRRDPEVLKFHLPMPHRFLPMQQVMLQFKIPGVMRMGGTEVRRKDAVTYMDGV